MNPSSKQGLFWIPRVLGLLFAAFLSVFALDVFTEFSGFWQTVGALAMHLIPTGIVLIALVIAWRWETVGGVLFISLCVLYLIPAWGRLHWSAYVVIGGPLFLVGALFLGNSLYRHVRMFRSAGQSL